MSLSDKQKIVEQIALLFASFVWTTVVLSVIALYWVYQDVNARWDYITQAPPQALAESVAAPTSTLTPSPTATEWAGPGPTATPTVTQPPTAIPTLVVGPPDVLPETFNADEPTPIPVIVHPEEEAAEVGLEPTATTSAPAGAPTTAPAPTSAPPQFAPVADEAVPVSTGITPSRLVIDSIGVDAQIIPVGWEIVEQDGQQYSIWKVADFAVGWHKTSASLGQPGNTVMAGHHNVQGEVFRDLVNVEVGDKVVVYADGKEFDYVVDLKTIVKEKGEPLEVRQQNAQWISHTDDERLTFITCWPYTNNTHRVIVVAKPL